MTEALPFPQSDFQIGLYVDLVQNGQLDLRAAASAALAFDRLVRELCLSAGLEDDIEFNLISGEKGSLNLKAVLISLKEKVRLKAVAIAVAGFLGGMAADEIKDQIRTALLGDPTVQLSEEAINSLANALAEKTCTDAAIEPLAEITEQLSKDDDVLGVGVTMDTERRPKHIRPRSQFMIGRTFQSSIESTEVTASRDNKARRRTVILTEPVLTTGPRRKWRVITENGVEVSASMQDKRFWQQLLEGKTGLPMAGGVHLFVSMSSKSEKDYTTGAWKEKDFVIHEVFDWKIEPYQTSFFDRPDDNNNYEE